jgi:hypothetical protein
MVVVLTFVEGWWGACNGEIVVQTDTVDGMRLNRCIRDVNKKHHVHMSNERVPAARVARNAQTLRNVHERMFAEAEDAGK